MAIDYYPGGLRIGHMNENVEGVRGSERFQIEAKFLVLILLNGRQVFSVDDREYVLEADEGAIGPCAITIGVKTSAEGQYRESTGQPLRKLAIAGQLDWFSQFQMEEGNFSGDARILPETFLADDGQNVMVHKWTPDAQVARLSTQVILPPPESSTQRLGLYRMSKGIEILRRISEEPDMMRPPAQLSGRRRAEDIRLYILDHLSSDLTMDQLESRFARNRRSLQRLFKAEYGIGIAEFVRVERLKRAHSALQNEGISIAEAAYQAGYSNTANFSTAFRREFGIPPARAKSSVA